MLSTLLALVAKLAIPTVVASVSAKIYDNKSTQSDTAYDAYNSYKNTLDAVNYDMDTKYLIQLLEMRNVITSKKAEEYIKLVDDAEKAYGNGHGWDDTFYDFSTNKKKHAKVKELYDVLAANVPEVSAYAKKLAETTTEELKNSFYAAIPEIADVPTPSYLDTNFTGVQRDVKPVKLWSGQELADLHKLDYNPDTYYDLIKNSAEAQVDLANYTSDQLNNASMVDDTQNVTSYLDSIRNTKANAIASGATLGQRAANEVLANTEALNNYSNNQAAVAQERLATVDEAVLANAQAKLNARQYFDSLAQSLANDSILLYANDTERFAQDLASNAEMYRADQELRGQRAYANAQMAGAYAQAQAAVNAARNSMNATANEYAWILDRFIGANNGDVAAGYKDFDKYIFSRYTGASDLLEYVNNKG